MGKKEGEKSSEAKARKEARGWVVGALCVDWPVLVKTDGRKKREKVWRQFRYGFCLALSLQKGGAAHARFVNEARAIVVCVYVKSSSGLIGTCMGRGVKKQAMAVAYGAVVMVVEWSTLGLQTEEETKIGHTQTAHRRVVLADGGLDHGALLVLQLDDPALERVLDDHALHHNRTVLT